MSDHYIGLDLFDLENNGLRQPISRITLYRGDNAALTAGDDTGLEVVADCIYVTQEMVEALLSAARGYQYHAYSAQAARLNPAAELGDTVEVGSIVSVLAQISDNGDLYPDIAAPGDREVEDEYPAAGPLTQALTKAFDKKLATARSEITKTTDEIAFAIYGENDKGGLNGKMATFALALGSISGRIDGVEGNYTQFQADLSGIATEVHGADGKGGLSGQYTALQQTVKDLSFKVVGIDGKETSVKLSDGKIDLSGLVTFSALEGSPGTGTTRINGGWIDADTLNLTDKLVFGDFTTAAKDEISGTASKAASTYIDEWRVESPQLIGAKILGGEYWDSDESGRLRLAVKPPSTTPGGEKISYPWLVYDATNYQGQTVELFSVVPIQKDFGWVAMTMLGQTILTVTESGKISPGSGWDFSGAKVTAVFGE